MTEVIKVVIEKDGRLISVFASGEWELEYAIDKTTKPKKGLIFAYAADKLSRVRSDCGGTGCRFFKAEAKVAGKVGPSDIDISHQLWDRWWQEFKVEESKGDYLLCSELTLLSEIK